MYQTSKLITLSTSHYQVTKSALPHNKTQSFIFKDCFAIAYILTGTFNCSTSLDQFIASSNQYILFNFNQKITLSNTLGVPCELLFLTLSPQYIFTLGDKEVRLSSCFESLSSLGHFLVSTHNDMGLLIKPLLKKLFFIHISPNAFGEDLFQSSMLTMLLILINRGYQEAITPSTNRTKPQTVLLDDLYIYINEHLQDDLSLDTLSKIFFVDKFYLSREFKKHAGITLHHHIVKQKLSYAKKLIASGMPIIEVYKHCGFGGYSHFFRAFKKEFNMTPKQYYKLSTDPTLSLEN